MGMLSSARIRRPRLLLNFNPDGTPIARVQFKGMKTMISLTAALCVAVATAPTSAQRQRRAMTIEDLIVAPRLADPQLSPDGRIVLYTQTATDGKTGRRNADIWSVPADGNG